VDQHGSRTGTVVFLGLLGPWTDKVRRTRLMSLMSGLRALVLSAMAVLFLTGNLSLLALAIAAFLVSGLTGLYDSAFAALLPSVAHRSKLTTANTWVAGIRSAGDIGAGATAGILLQLLSPVALFISDAVTYLVSALAIGLSGHSWQLSCSQLSRAPACFYSRLDKSSRTYFSSGFRSVSGRLA
jgi:hypothetical protein